MKRPKKVQLRFNPDGSCANWDGAVNDIEHVRKQRVGQKKPKHSLQNGEKERVVAVIPVHGRLPILRLTIERLLKKNGCYAVVCAGWTDEEKMCCEEAGAIFIKHENLPLSNKWNACFQKAKELDPHACLFIGSDDWISENWIPRLYPSLYTHGMVGKAGCYMLDISEKHGYRMVNWAGYTNSRKGEPIGAGRLICASVLNDLDWKPFDDGLNMSLDFSMMNRVIKSGYTIGCVNYEDIISIGFSSDKWDTKHNFESHWNNQSLKKIDNPESFMDDNFPEHSHIFSSGIFLSEIAKELGIGLKKGAADVYVLYSDISYSGDVISFAGHEIKTDNPREFFAHILSKLPPVNVKIIKGHNVTIGQNCSIGGRGFGYEGGVAIAHFGNVIIGDNVCIHNNVNIDRGVIGDTVIGSGTKIDSLVHIAHNVQIGENCLIVAGSVIGGSCVIGNNVFVGMNVSIKQKVKIGDGAILGAGAVVTKDVPAGETWVGCPAKKIN